MNRDIAVQTDSRNLWAWRCGECGWVGVDLASEMSAWREAARHGCESTPRIVDQPCSVQLFNHEGKAIQQYVFNLGGQGLVDTFPDKGVRVKKIMVGVGVGLA